MYFLSGQAAKLHLMFFALILITITITLHSPVILAWSILISWIFTFILEKIKYTLRHFSSQYRLTIMCAQTANTTHNGCGTFRRVSWCVLNATALMMKLLRHRLKI
ncbi:hypothetical protein FKM82_018419 [Ascaphus truei]